MSYSIIKSITFDNFNRTAHWRSACNNVSPRIYDKGSIGDPNAIGWGRYEHDYEGFKRQFAEWLFGGECQFLPSCKSVAHRVFKLVNRSFGFRFNELPFHGAYERFPYHLNPKTGDDEFGYRDDAVKSEYDKLKSEWIEAYVKVLDEFIGVPEDRTLSIFEEAI